MKSRNGVSQATSLLQKTKIAVIIILISLLTVSARSPHRPVLFVHGWMGSAPNWDAFKTKLIADGWSSDIIFANTFANNTDLTDGSNERNAKEIATWVDEILKKTGATSVDLVSHSMGGLSTRYYVKFLGGNTKVSHYISLGSPQHGTTLAKLAGDMSPTSAFLKKLNEGDETPAGLLPDSATPHVPGNVAWASFYSTTDELILPSETAKLNGATNKIIDISHIAFLSDQTVYQWIKAFLTDQTISISQPQAKSQSNKSLTILNSVTNHATGTITITYALSKTDAIHIHVLNSAGKTVSDLLLGTLKAGTHSVQWNGIDTYGNQIGHGIYFFSLENSSQRITRQLFFADMVKSLN
ncbi:MAG: alpha/beta fold hydrolase [Chitinivibrionales bacterium]|nr:alpha/beta fold hydrolase [Chitinivibrionales bacterium]